MKRKQNILNKGIIIVDDDLDIRETITDWLLFEGFHNLYQAENGVKCLSLLHEHSEEISLIILDMHMPEMDGLEVLQHLLHVHNEIVGVIVITAYEKQYPEQDVMGYKSTNILNDTYLKKPISRDILIKKVYSTLNSIQKKEESILNGELSLIRQDLNNLKIKVHELSKKVPNLMTNLGIEILKTIIIGLFVLALLYFNIDEVLANIINNIIH